MDFKSLTKSRIPTGKARNLKNSLQRCENARGSIPFLKISLVNNSLLIIMPVSSGKDVSEVVHVLRIVMAEFHREK